jgi:hypothetical protein
MPRTVEAMNRRHATVIALLLGVAALLGTFAVIRTASLGAASRAATDSLIAAQQRRLVAAERSLRQTLATGPAPGATPAVKAPKTVYVRPAPIVVHIHRHGDDGEGSGFGD